LNFIFLSQSLEFLLAGEKKKKKGKKKKNKKQKNGIIP